MVWRTTAVQAGQMKIEVSNEGLRQPLERTAEVLRTHGGYVDKDFTVHEQSGDFWCSADGDDGRVLLRYDPSLCPPVGDLTWSDDRDLLIPEALPAMTPAQRELLDMWLPLINDTGKIASTRARVPRFAVQSWPLRHHLADGGYPSMREDGDEAAVRRLTVAWHSDAGRLLPLKCLVNHHPRGAAQTPMPGSIAVVKARADGTQTFERYGALDGMRALLGFGFVLDQVPVVHSVPIRARTSAGVVEIRRRAPREPSRVPTVTRVGETIRLGHLSFSAEGRAGLTEALGIAAAELFDAALIANLEYYAHLDRLVLEAVSINPATILVDLTRMSMAQQAYLHAWDTRGVP